MATLTTNYQRIGTSTYTVSGSNELRLYAKYNSQSITNNTSNVSIQLRTIALSGYYYSSGNSSTLSCVGNRGTQYYDIGTVNTSSEKTIGTWTFDLSHSSSGSLTGVGASASANVYGSLNPSVSGSFDLPTIPRQANVTSATDFTDEGNPTITFNNAGGFRINARLEFSGQSIQRDNIPNTGSYTFNLTETERNKLRSATPNNVGMTVREVIATCIGGTSETHWSWLDKTMTIVNGEPTLSYDIVETDEDVIEIVGTNELLIKNVTKPKVTLTGTPKKYATISKYTMELNGNYVEGNEYTFNKLTGNSLKMSVTDSRGFTTQETETLDIIDYFNPSATIYVPRAEEDDDNAYINIDGTWYNEGFGNVDNELTITWQYRESEVETWTYGGTITPTITNNTFKVEDYLLGNDFSYAKEYKIKVTISDLFNTRDYTTTRQKNDYSLKDTYYESDIFTYEDANSIEDYIYQTYVLLNKQMGTSYSYTKQLWYKNSALLVPKLNHIEEGIKLLGQYYYRPEGWQKTKIWNATKPEKFDYTDVNRWINNLNLITERLYNESNSLFPSDTLYPSETLLPH